MKRTIQYSLMVPLLFIIAACGGGGSDQPAPAAATPDGNAQLKQLFSLSQNAQQVCCQSAAPYMVAVGRSLFSPAGTSVTGPLPQPNMSNCQQSVLNFEMLFRTIDNGQYANRPDAQQWRQDQGAGVVNCVGAQMQAAGLPVTPANLPLYFTAAQGLTAQLQNAVPTLGIPALQSGAATLAGVNAYGQFQARTGLSSIGLGLGLGGTNYNSPTTAIANNPYAYGSTANGTALGANPYGSSPTTLGANGAYANALGVNPYGFTSTLGAFPYSTYGTGTNNPYATTQPTTTNAVQSLASAYGAPNFNSPNAASQIFSTLPTIP
jgi:hypothetical protein